MADAVLGRVGVAHPSLHAAQADPMHEVWARGQADQTKGSPPRRVDMAICGTAKFDKIVRGGLEKTQHFFIIC
eukprot:SAG31_NODE_1018_length_10354_cov_10.995514_2_plen_73_part_00